MSIFTPEIEIVDKSGSSLRYLEHGWPTPLCRWHAHEEYELHLLLATSGKALIGDYIGRFEPGQLFLTGPMLPHNWVTTSRSDETIPVRDMLVQFDHSTITNAARYLPEFKQFEPMLELAQMGIEFVGFDPSEATERLASIRDGTGMDRLVGFLTFMIRLRDWPSKRSLSTVHLTPKGRDDVRDNIGKAVDHITANFSENLDVAKAAEIANMNPRVFANQFRIQTGNSFKDFVNRLRIGQACVLLLETDLRISNIGKEVGYNNLAHFNRNFLRIVGMVPRDFRRARTDGAPGNMKYAVAS